MDNGAGIEAGSETISVAVVDDHPAIAFALEAAIAREGHSETLGEDGDAAGARRPLELVGVARTTADALDLLARTGPLAPDVVLCDIQLEGGIEGLRVLDAVRAAGRRSIVLTSFDRSSLMRAAFERGASGFLHKSADVGEIVAAIRQVAGGGTAFSGVSLDAARFAPRLPSEREIAVLRELQRGATSEEIGARLGISTRTVESHLRRLFDRYGVVSRTELAVLAMNEGWLDARPS